MAAAEGKPGALTSADSIAAAEAGSIVADAVDSTVAVLADSIAAGAVDSNSVGVNNFGNYYADSFAGNPAGSSPVGTAGDLQKCWSLCRRTIQLGPVAGSKAARIQAVVEAARKLVAPADERPFERVRVRELAPPHRE